MSEHSESHPILRRYLTPFYGFTLGLALILAIIAILVRPQATSRDVNPTQVTAAHTAVPSGDSTQTRGDDSPTTTSPVPPTADEKTPSPLGVTAMELDGLQVKLWHPWSETTGNVFQALLDEFNRSNRWGIRVDASGYDGFGRLDEAVESALKTNPLPDVIVDYGYTARHWDNLQAMVDLTPYVDDPVWGLSSEEQGDFFQGFWGEDITPAAGSATARRLGIPFYRSAYAIFYNRSWASELGYPEPPANPQEFREQACAAAGEVARQGGKSEPAPGGYLVTSQAGVMVGWIYAFGGEITDPGEEKYSFNSGETTAALQFLKNLQVSGCAWTGTAINPPSEFANRQALFMAGSLFDLAEQERAFAQAGSTDEWVVIPFPSDIEPAVETYGPSLFVNRSTPAQQLAAWLVIKWLLEPQNQAGWSEELQVFPVRLSALDYLGNSSGTNLQWTQALGLLTEAHAEPSFASWGMVRWAFADAMAMLFEPQFDVEQIPVLLADLDSVAAEILSQVR